MYTKRSAHLFLSKGRQWLFDGRLRLGSEVCGDHATFFLHVYFSDEFTIQTEHNLGDLAVGGGVGWVEG